MSAFGGKADITYAASATRLGVTNGTVLDQKCDILFTPDLVLGAGEAMRRREFKSAAICFTAMLVACMARAAAVDRRRASKRRGTLSLPPALV